MRVAIAAVLVLPLPPLAQSGVSPSNREMSTDWPDKTRLPYSVSKGRDHAELDFANYPRERSEDGRIETIGVELFK